MTELFVAGKSYSSLNCARSALSTFLINSSGLTIGNSPSVKRFLKGVFELRPPCSRVNFIWDVSIVLNYLSIYFPLKDIPLDILTYKCVMLLALASMQRVQTLISIETLLKQSSAKKYKFSLHLPRYKDPAVCPYTTLLEYIDKTKSLRGKSLQLFVSFHKPHKPVSRSTISRWLKRVLFESGIDISVFSAHSTRAAAASAARDDDMPIDDILRIGGWSNAKSSISFIPRLFLDT